MRKKKCDGSTILIQRQTIADTQETVFARVLDSCGKDTSLLTCKDIGITEAALTNLTTRPRRRRETELEFLNWSFVREPCVACAQSKPGKQPFAGFDDDCTGADSEGVMRHGRLGLSKQDALNLCGQRS